MFFILPSVVFAILLSLFSYYRPPVWRDEQGYRNVWLWVVLGSAVGGVLAGLLSLLTDGNSVSNTLHALSLTGLGYVFTQSVVTDFCSRLVDRRVINTASLVSFVTGGVNMYLYNWSDSVFILWLCVIMLAGALLFVPALGQSDARAFMLAFASSVPFVGFELLKTGFVMMGGLVVLYMTAYFIVNRVPVSRVMTLKVSTPMVPIILLPFIIVHVM